MPRPVWICLLLVSLVMGFPGCKGESSTDSGSESSGSDSGDAGSPSGTMQAGAVGPTLESIQSGEYPLARPVYIYVNKASLAKPGVVAFVSFYLSDEGQAIVSEVPAIPMSASRLADSRSAWQAATADLTPPSEVKGEVLIDGSSTVGPISAAMAEDLAALHPKLRVTVNISGTGGGMKRFTRGEIDICDASRQIKESEQEACTAAGIEYVELQVAIDGITIVVHNDNDWIGGITLAQLRRIWETDAVKKWNEVDPAWPDQEFKLFGPDTDSGTFEYFTEAVNGEAKKSRSDYEQSANDNVLVTGVAGEKYSLGYFGFGYYVENKDRLKALAVAR